MVEEIAQDQDRRCGRRVLSAEEDSKEDDEGDVCDEGDGSHNSTAKSP